MVSPKHPQARQVTCTVSDFRIRCLMPHLGHEKHHASLICHSIDLFYTPRGRGVKYA